MSTQQQKRGGRFKGGRPPLEPVVVRNEGEGFRHYFDTESQTTLTDIGTSAVAAYNGKLNLVTGQANNGDTNSVSLITGRAFRNILKQPSSRLGKHSADLARAIILGECENLPTESIGVTVGRFVVSKGANSGRGYAFVATIEDPAGVLGAEFDDVVSKIQAHEGVSDLGIKKPELHVTLGVLPPMDNDLIFPVARSLSEQYHSTPLTLLPLK